MIARQRSTSSVVVAPERARAISGALRRWFRRHGRDLPWRRTRDPYQVLVSELMLQQTQVSRVVTYYHDFLITFPTLAHVARAPRSRVLSAWQGLGYYERARNLHRLAIEITDRGRTAKATLPRQTERLRALPGVGAYTAGAVSSFAYEQRAALVDTNVGRVLARALAPRVNPKSSRGAKVVWALAEQILPRTGRSTWTHNQAIMELGALVCTARVARCGVCPIARWCASQVAGSDP